MTERFTASKPVDGRVLPYNLPPRVALGSSEPAATGDPYFADVYILLPCDGSNGSTTFTDFSTSPKTVTATNVTVNTSVKRYGTGAASFPGTGSNRLTFTDPALGTGAFDIEFWFKSDSTTQYAQMIGCEAGGASSGYTLVINNNSASGGQIALYRAGGLVFVSGATDYSDDQWHYLAMSRHGSSIQLRIDGVVVATATNSASFTGSALCYVGDNNAFAGRTFRGSIDDLRITKGRSRYVQFDAPVDAHPVIGGAPEIPATSLDLYYF